MDTAFIVKIAGLGWSVVTLLFTLLMHMRDWFSVPKGLRWPIFSLWYVCFGANADKCSDPITEYQHDIIPALYKARILALVAGICVTMLVILCIGAVLNSPKIANAGPIFPFLAAVAFICLIIACPYIEGGVRLQVARKVTIPGQPRTDTVTGNAGICAWIAVLCNLANIGAMSAMFALGSGHGKKGSEI